MLNYVIVSIIGGFLFGIMDGLLNANPLAQNLFKVYKPIVREQINVPAGLVIDLVHGFALAGIFLLLQASLPGETVLMKGLSFGVLVWFLRVAMYAASQWMMFTISGATVAYLLLAGLVEMLILGIFYSRFLKPLS